MHWSQTRMAPSDPHETSWNVQGQKALRVSQVREGEDPMSRRFIVQRCGCARSTPMMRFMGKRGWSGQISRYQCPRCGRIRDVETRNCTRQAPRKGLIEKVLDALLGGN